MRYLRWVQHVLHVVTDHEAETPQLERDLGMTTQALLRRVGVTGNEHPALQQALNDALDDLLYYGYLEHPYYDPTRVRLGSRGRHRPRISLHLPLPKRVAGQLLLHVVAASEEEYKEFAVRKPVSVEILRTLADPANLPQLLDQLEHDHYLGTQATRTEKTIKPRLGAFAYATNEARRGTGLPASPNM